MKFIIAKKKEMSQVFGEDGTVTPVTVLEAGPVVVTQVKTEEKDGYKAVQVGFGKKSAKQASKSVIGHTSKHAKSDKPFAVLKEFRVESDGFEAGQSITVESFQPGDKVHVTGTSIGRGFAGVVKRHGFGGSPASHGHKDQLRMPGSIGAQDPQHVFKGTRMGGRMGGKTVTTKNLEVVEVDATNNILKVKGAVPGANGGYITVVTEASAESDNKESK